MAESGELDGGGHENEIIDVEDEVHLKGGPDEDDKGSLKETVDKGSHHEISQLSSQDVADPMITVHEVNAVGTMTEPGVDGGGGVEVAENVGVSGTLTSQDGAVPADALHNEEEAYAEEDVDDGKDGFPVRRKRAVRAGEQIPTMDPKHPHVKVGRYVVDDVAYNTRGYQVCGFVNQRGTLCGRIGNCPFHASKQKPVALPIDQRTAPVQRMTEPGKEGLKAMADCQGVVRLEETPVKKRFKQSWTPEEHQRFLEAMRRYGKGNWKKIAEAVGSRTANQCQSHAQKYFMRQSTPREQRKKKSIHDAVDSMDPGADDPSGIHRLSQLAAGGNATHLAHVQTQNGLTVPIVFPLGGLGPGGVQALQMGMAGAPGLLPMDQATLNAAVTSAALGAQKMRVTVHRNGESSGGKAIILPNTMEQFFRMASEKLEGGKNYCRAFTRSGGEISNLDELCHDDSLWLTDGGEFIFPPQS